MPPNVPPPPNPAQTPAKPTFNDVTASESKPLAYQPQDEATAAKVKEFIATHATEEGAAPAAPGVPAPAAPVDLPPSPELAETQSEAFYSEALRNIENVTVDDKEKELFIKAILNDDHFRLTLPMYGGKLQVELRSRSHYEQRRVLDTVRLDQKEGEFPADGDITYHFDYVQKYCTVLMVERVNGVVFSDLILKAGGTVAEDAAVLRKAVKEKIEGLPNIYWNSILNAMRMFDRKCAIMNSRAADESFWKPRASEPS
jgi:hypothetical protein